MGSLPSEAIPTYRPASNGRESVIVTLLKLDSPLTAGIPEAEFNRLFAKCRCGLVMTRRNFEHHVCAMPAAPIIIDLTSDSDDDMVPNHSEPSQRIVVDLTIDSDDD
jgi:hypothetical protein